MQTLYATHLPLPRGVDALKVALSSIESWTRDRFGTPISTSGSGESNHDDVHLRWDSHFGADHGLFGLSVEHDDRQDPLWRWRTLVDVGVEPGGGAWTRVRVALSSPAEGLVARPRVEVGRPRLVRRLADSLPIRVDDWALGESRGVDRSSVEAYTAFLLDPGRQLPVVALSHSDEDETFVDRLALADRLLGLAHVVEIERSATFAIGDVIGNRLNCYRGAVRIYYPRFTTADDPYHHQLFVGGSLGFLGSRGLERELFATLGRLAALTVDEPKLRQRVRRERRAAEFAAMERAQAEVSERLASAATQSGGGVDAETWTAFCAEYEQFEGRVRSLERDLLDADVELEDLREALDRSEARAKAFQESLLHTRDRPPMEDAEVGPPSSVLEAVRRAEKSCPHLVLLPEAFASAEASHYPYPSRVLDDLELMETIAHEWSDGELPAGPNEAFKGRCNGYRDGISDSALNKYGVDYRREYNGDVIALGPHIARGRGAITEILRIYWWLDSETKKLVVGHVGRKLRDDSNPN